MLGVKEEECRAEQAAKRTKNLFIKSILIVIPPNSNAFFDWTRTCHCHGSKQSKALFK